MTLYQPGIPTGTVNLDQDYQNLQNNFQQINTTYAVDHIPLTQATNNGFHNQCTMPLIAGSSHPPTGTNCIFYTMQDASNVGLIQYSRGPNNAPPTPITELHSSSTPIIIAPNGTTNVLDMTGLFQLVATLYIMNYGPNPATNTLTVCDLLWNGNGGNGFKFLNRSTANAPLQAINFGTILQIQNTNAAPANNVFWTLTMHRINT